jgi:DNA topoisomerase I
MHCSFFIIHYSLFIPMNLLDPVQTARAAKLVYRTDVTPGISRHRTDDGFSYVRPDGQTVADDETLARIHKLALPPAWESVWIADRANSHLQATGTDSKGRKQYRYHANWNAIRSETKFFRMTAFGQKLPDLRARLDRDLRQKTLSRDKVIAVALSVMEQTLIRIGNAAYEKEYGSYGLTTLKDDHVKAGRESVRFTFKGKKGVYHDITLRDKRLARLVKACRDIDGQELFQYLDDAGEPHPIDSGMVNRYLQETMGDDFSAKDFRTWAGTVNALRLLVDLPPCETEKELKKNVNTVLDQVSERLGNTRTVCRAHYVHPQLLEAYECQDLKPYIARRNRYRQTSPHGLDGVEKLLLAFLNDQAKQVLKKSGKSIRPASVPL